MAELTREAFQEIQTRLKKETEAAEKKRVEDLNLSNKRLNKQNYFKTHEAFCYNSKCFKRICN